MHGDWNGSRLKITIPLDKEATYRHFVCRNRPKKNCFDNKQWN